MEGVVYSGIHVYRCSDSSTTPTPAGSGVPCRHRLCTCWVAWRTGEHGVFRDSGVQVQ